MSYPISSSMAEQLKPIDKRPALILDIVETILQGMLSYQIQVIHQKYRGDSFTKDDSGERYFEASNGFILSSDGVQKLQKVIHLGAVVYLLIDYLYGVVGIVVIIE